MAKSKSTNYGSSHISIKLFHLKKED